jgi:hypothetical protein
VLRQSKPAAALKRSRSSSPDVEPQPLMALPMAVWEDHLLLLLKLKDAARLSHTCKPLRAVVREHFMEFGYMKMDKLQAALTTFPRAQSVKLEDMSWGSPKGGGAALVNWLHEGGRGRHLVTVRSESKGPCDVIHTALQRGAIPSLKGVDVPLQNETVRASLTGRFLRGLHELYVRVDSMIESQVTALGGVRHLPALTKLELRAEVRGRDPDVHGFKTIHWPPFVPPTLTTLCIAMGNHSPSLIQSLLPALPGTLEASGARLQRLDVRIYKLTVMGESLVHVAQTLRCCSPTLTAFRLVIWMGGYTHVDAKAEDCEDQLERLREQWAAILSGVSACRELQVLVLPRIEVEHSFPPGTVFGHLTELELWCYEPEGTPDAGVVGLWELMASGGVPALAKLSVRLGEQHTGPEEVKTRVAPALEAVAGTLTHLYLGKAEADAKGQGAGEEWLRVAGGVRGGGGGGQAAAAQGPRPGPVL